MTVTYIGDSGRVYSTISVGGETLSPVPGQNYNIEDPGDGRWISASTSNAGVTTPPKNAENPPADSLEGNEN